MANCSLNVTALVMIFFALPETKQRTLEEVSLALLPILTDR